MQEEEEYGSRKGGMAVVERERSSATVVSVSGVTVVIDRQWLCERYSGVSARQVILYR